MGNFTQCVGIRIQADLPPPLGLSYKKCISKFFCKILYPLGSVWICLYLKIGPQLSQFNETDNSSFDSFMMFFSANSRVTEVSTQVCLFVMLLCLFVARNVTFLSFVFLVFVFFVANNLTSVGTSSGAMWRVTGVSAQVC